MDKESASRREALLVRYVELSFYGLGLPHWPQKLPLFSAPQFVQNHVAGTSGSGSGMGFAVPHWLQKLPVCSEVHCGQIQALAAGAAAATGAAWGSGCG